MRIIFLFVKKNLFFELLIHMTYFIYLYRNQKIHKYASKGTIEIYCTTT